MNSRGSYETARGETGSSGPEHRNRSAGTEVDARSMTGKLEAQPVTRARAGVPEARSLTMHGRPADRDRIDCRTDPDLALHFHMQGTDVPRLVGSSFRPASALEEGPRIGSVRGGAKQSQGQERWPHRRRHSLRR